MSTYALPVVDKVVDKAVGVAENNWLYKLPVVGDLLKTAVGLVLDAIGYFAFALVFGGALFYTWAPVATMSGHHLGTLGSYWDYVVAVIGLTVACLLLASLISAVVDALRLRTAAADADNIPGHNAMKADVLRPATRAAALKSLTVPGLLIMLAWFITTYIQ